MGHKVAKTTKNWNFWISSIFSPKMANKWFHWYLTAEPKNPYAHHFFGTFSSWAFGTLGDVKHMWDSVSPFSIFLRYHIFQFFDLKASKVKKLKNVISQENGKWGNWISHMFYITQGAKSSARESSKKMTCTWFFWPGCKKWIKSLISHFGAEKSGNSKFSILGSLCDFMANWCLKNYFFVRPTI